MSTLDSPSLLHTFFNPEITAKTAPLILDAAWQTIAIALLIIATGMVLGTLLASLRYYHAQRNKAMNRWMVRCIVGYADVLRTLPPLVLLILVYFALPYLNIAVDSVTATWLCLSVVLSAFIEECIWTGLSNLPKGQMEAARSTGLTWFKAMRHVCLPQAFKGTLPQITNRCIATVKNTALGSVIGFGEILGAAQTASSDFANPTPLTLCALIYIAMIFPLVLFSRYLEHKARSQP
ncbi:amino acid ABC transporter permease [Lampropedia puyangensis]|uniref:Amino acid ABC transporter permease n=1 Tax=Lampropedia puyangensis TaxID=1330072 RepID=A0A4S8EMJ7_9BURK|nr:amino acid ABC transporter permease [Lampropedia puyangensis]THT95959.1 amino acid ABC transporter permease [Lampropedia puyangensis]